MNILETLRTEGATRELVHAMDLQVFLYLVGCMRDEGDEEFVIQQYGEAEIQLPE